MPNLTNYVIIHTNISKYLQMKKEKLIKTIAQTEAILDEYKKNDTIIKYFDEKIESKLMEEQISQELKNL